MEAKKGKRYKANQARTSEHTFAYATEFEPMIQRDKSRLIQFFRIFLLKNPC